MAPYERAPRHVVAARYAGNYQVWLQFNDGRKGVVDLADKLHGATFEPLRNRERFAQLYLDCELATIAWEHGADFAPDRCRSDDQWRFRRCRRASFRR